MNRGIRLYSKWEPNGHSNLSHPTVRKFLSQGGSLYVYGDDPNDMDDGYFIETIKQFEDDYGVDGWGRDIQHILILKPKNKYPVSSVNGEKVTDMEDGEIQGAFKGGGECFWMPACDVSFVNNV